jgi:hypothetical protein
MDPMSKRSGILGLWAVAVVVVATACAAPTQTPAASVAAPASPTSSVAVAASPSPSASPSPTPEATATPTPTATPAPTPVPTPVAWLTYKSKRNKYSMKYPPDWVVTPGSAGHPDQFDDYQSHFVTVFRDTVSTYVDLNGTVSQEIALMKSHYKAKLLTNKLVHVGAYSGKILTFNATDNGRKYYVQIVIIKRGAVGYFIDMWSDPGTEGADRKLFLRIYNSFKPQF